LTAAVCLAAAVCLTAAQSAVVLRVRGRAALLPALPCAATNPAPAGPAPQVEDELGVPLSEVFVGQAAPLRVLGVVRGEGFKLRDRAHHVYAEAERVYAFRAAAEVRAGGEGGRGRAARRRAGALRGLLLSPGRGLGEGAFARGAPLHPPL
jgi:hypothetical protein